MTDDRLTLSRRKLLAAAGAVGAASTGLGLTTSAYFSDRETFQNDRLVAGQLDMRVGFEERYSNWSPDEAAGLAGNVSRPTNRTLGEPSVGLPTQAPINGSPLIALRNASDAERFLNNTTGESPDPGDDTRDAAPDGFDAATAARLDSPCESDLLVSDIDRPTIRLSDVKPGDFGYVTVSFALCDNPGFVWAVGRLADASENGTSESESDDPDEDADVVELLDAVETAIWIDDGNTYQNRGESPVFTGTLRETLRVLDHDAAFGNVERSRHGLLLPGNVPAEQGGGRGPNCFAAGETHGVVLAWWLPVDHANEIQSDSVTFDIGLRTEQCRHNAVDADAPVRTAKLSAADPTEGAYLGADAALDGGTLALSADGLDLHGSNSGAVYVFDRETDGWQRTSRLVPADAGSGQLFGEAIDLTGETLVCGATGDDEHGTDAGAAYAFERDGGKWTQTAKLAPPALAAGDSFGQDVAVGDGRAVVGADGDSTDGSAAGAVYVFARTDGTWSERAVLTPSDGRAEKYFGSRVALDGETLVVGAYGDDERGTNAGAAYVFDRVADGWSQTAKLVSPTSSEGAFFGSSVAIDGDTVVVGAFAAGSRDTGAAYAFTRSGDGYGSPVRLDPPTLSPGSFFGWAADVDDDSAVVGAYGADVAHVFDRNGGEWTARARLTPASVASGDRFGVSVAAGTDATLVTADGDDEAGPNTGAAYVFDGGDVDA